MTEMPRARASPRCHRRLALRQGANANGRRDARNEGRTADEARALRREATAMQLCTAPRSFLCLLMVACTSSTQANAPVRVDAMVTWIERVHVEAERSRQAVGDAFERLNAIAAG